MLLTLKPERLKRYKDIALFILKHANEGITSYKSTDNLLEDEDEKNINGDPEKFAKDLEELGPTFIKLGQLLSTRPDFLPIPYIEALTKLQDKIEPFPYQEVEEIIENEIGVRISKAFQEFNSEPVAAASLGQVHKAILRDGRPAAVKIQRPGIRKIILNDLETLNEIAVTVDKHTSIGRQYAFQDILAQFKQTILTELDYRQEAQNLIKLGNNLKNYDNIIIPQPINDYSTSQVLTMDYIKGRKVTKLSNLTRIEMSGNSLAEDLFKAYLDQVLVDGFFHADPHPGNVFLTEDFKIALLDLGMVAHIDPEMREKLMKLLLYISEGRGHEATKISIQLGTKLENYDEESLLRFGSDFVARYYNASLKQIQVGRIVMELAQISARYGVRTPPQLTMLGKTLLNLDIIGHTLNPDFNPNEIIRSHADSILRKYTLKSLSPGNIFSSFLEMNEIVQKLPSRLNSFMDAIAKNEFEFRIKAFDEIRLIESIQKIANRITLGLILAALIIGAALMMDVNSPFTILGYPGFSMLMFIAAATFGFALVISIFMNDEWKKKK